VLWPILHWLSVRAGQGQCLAKCRADEARELVWLFTHLESIVPCVECKKHIEDYRKANPLPAASAATRDAVREFEVWVWTFHEAVNHRLGKGEGPSLEEARSKWKGIQGMQEYGRYIKVLGESVLKGSVQGQALREWHRHLWLLNACY
jgi:hypothetical protein